MLLYSDPDLLQDERLKVANSAHQRRICRSSLTPSSSNASHPFLLPFVIRPQLLFIRPLVPLFSDESGDPVFIIRSSVSLGSRVEDAETFVFPEKPQKQQCCWETEDNKTFTHISHLN
ncbi:hypothetical protein QQF64_003309 [Cirrhinus molitorella]|uniref:Uncharacterized protein n=1 Tax=Cirrhinus molitorella TaxID=172907 RepID=A0ABR3MJN1_9TELE